MRAKSKREKKGKRKMFQRLALRRGKAAGKPWL